MTLTDYIKAVCDANFLEDTADWLLRSDEDNYYVDRHVDQPPDNLSSRAACSAGLALLHRWNSELPKIRELGIFSSTPKLIIDDGWLADLEDAPPPHIWLTLSKHRVAPYEQEIPEGQCAVSICPFSDLLTGSFKSVKITRFDARPEWETPGGWILEFTASEPTLFV